MSSSDPILEGTFTKDKANAFVDALSLLASIDVKKLVLEFKGDGVKTLSVYALNTANTVNMRLHFDPCLLDGFTITKDFNYGITDINDLVGILDVFENGFSIKMSEDIASISSNENYLDYYGADQARIKRGESAELDCKLLASITCDGTFKEFIKAIGKTDNNHIVFKGDAAKKSITISLMDKDVRGNTFSKLVQVPDIAEDFKVSINREYFKKVLTTSCSFNIYREAIQLTKKTDLFTIEYLILTLV
jgi:hypothetical protein